MAVAVVVIKDREGTFEIHGRTVGASEADEFVANFEINFFGPLDVIADEQIEPAVVVVINKGRAGAPVVRRIAEAGGRSDVAKFAAAFVVKKVVPADRSDENVRQSVVVKITNSDAHSVN